MFSEPHMQGGHKVVHKENKDTQPEAMTALEAQQLSAFPMLA